MKQDSTKLSLTFLKATAYGDWFSETCGVWNRWQQSKLEQLPHLCDDQYHQWLMGSQPDALGVCSISTRRCCASSSCTAARSQGVPHHTTDITWHSERANYELQTLSWEPVGIYLFLRGSLGLCNWETGVVVGRLFHISLLDRPADKSHRAAGSLMSLSAPRMAFRQLPCSNSVWLPLIA